MGFAVAFCLADLDQLSPLSAGFQVFWVIFGTVLKGVIGGKHDTVRQVRNVRNGQHIAPCVILIGLHPFPQITRIGAAFGWGHQKRRDLQCAIGTIAENDVSVQVVARDK